MAERQDRSESPAQPGSRRGRAADSVERIYAIIKDWAIEYRFLPGQKINEVELAAQLSVSRTPVRAALNRLERDGFVINIPNRGFFAREISPAAVTELYELRAAVERAAFVHACARASDAQVEATVAAWESHGDPEEGGSWEPVALADEAFHMALVRLSGNGQMALAVEALSTRIRFFRRLALEALPQRAQSYRDHAAIIDALRRRDAAGGADLLERHITASAEHAAAAAARGMARIFFGSAA